MLDWLRRWAEASRRDVLALYLAGRDPRVPWYAKALAIATAAYALSPIDLIPDFIPVLGYLDDLVIVPLAIMLTVRLIPAPVLEELRREASQRLAGRPGLGWGGAAVVVAVWIALAMVIAFALLAWAERGLAAAPRRGPAVGRVSNPPYCPGVYLNPAAGGRLP